MESELEVQRSTEGLHKAVYLNYVQKVSICMIYYIFKACAHYFLSIFYFSASDIPSKTMKNVFYFIKKLFSYSRHSNFCIFIFPSSFSLSAIALEVDERKILKFMMSSTA